MKAAKTSHTVLFAKPEMAHFNDSSVSRATSRAEAATAMPMKPTAAGGSGSTISAAMTAAKTAKYRTALAVRPGGTGRARITRATTIGTSHRHWTDTGRTASVDPRASWTAASEMPMVGLLRTLAQWDTTASIESVLGKVGFRRRDHHAAYVPWGGGGPPPPEWRSDPPPPACRSGCVICWMARITRSG